MTHIARYKTKKEFKAAVSGKHAVFLEDPSIMRPVSGHIDHVVNVLDVVYVTNHPNRTWYASVSRDPKTKRLVVE